MNVEKKQDNALVMVGFSPNILQSGYLFQGPLSNNCIV